MTEQPELLVICAGIVVTPQQLEELIIVIEQANREWHYGDGPESDSKAFLRERLGTSAFAFPVIDARGADDPAQELARKDLVRRAARR